MELFRIIQKIESTSKSSEKMAILEKHSNNIALKTFFKLCLDPKLLYGYNKVKDDKDLIFALPDEEEYDPFMVITGSLVKNICTRKITGNKAVKFIHHLFQRCKSDEERDLLYRIIRKDPDCGIGDKSPLKVWPDIYFIPPYQKYYAFDHEKDNKVVRFPAIVQKKEDGGFFYIIANNGSVQLMTRAGNIVTLPEELPVQQILTKLASKKNFVLEGEALLIDIETAQIVTKRQTINGIFNSWIQGTAEVEEITSAYHVIFSCWNLLSNKELKDKDGGNVYYSERFNALTKMLSEVDSPLLQVVESKEVNSYEEAESFAFEIIAHGGEGAMLKNKKQKWKDGTTRDGWKLKGEYTADLLCTETKPHSKDDRLIGSIKVVSSCGKLSTWVGSGFDDKDRDQLPEDYVGKIIEVKFTDISTSKSKDGMSSFSFARFNGIRHDKTEADSLHDVNMGMDAVINQHLREDVVL